MDNNINWAPSIAACAASTSYADYLARMAKLQEAIDVCTHPQAERDITKYPDAGYLNVPTGWRVVCRGCGTDFGPCDDAYAESFRSLR